MGIEPTLSAWEAEVLPLNDARVTVIRGYARAKKTPALGLGFLTGVSNPECCQWVATPMSKSGRPSEMKGT